MKQKASALTLVLLCALLLLSGCQKEPTWQDCYDLGVQAMEEENYEEAISHFEDAIALEPSKSEAYSALADVYIAMEDWEKALEILQQGIDTTGDAALTAKAEEVTAKLEELSRPQYLVDYLGMTVNELAEIWGEDYSVMDDLFLGGSKGIFYEDFRASANFYFSDPLNEDVKTGEEKIHIIETAESDWMIEEGIPSRATYVELQRLNLGGEVIEGDDAEWAFEYWYQADDSTTVRFCWDYGQDPNTTYPWVTLYRDGLDAEITTTPSEPESNPPAATSISMGSHGGVWHSTYVAEDIPMEEVVIHSIESGTIAFDFTCYRLYAWENITGQFISSNTASFRSGPAEAEISGRLIFEPNSITLIIDSSTFEYVSAGAQYQFQTQSNERRL